jgi:heat shock protein HslJ
MGLLACGTEKAPASGETEAGTAAESPIGSWRLVSMGLSDSADSPVAGTELTLDWMADGQVAGSSGCNRYFGTFERSETGTLSAGPFGSTRMACPPEVMSQESRFLEALEGASRFEIQGGGLVLLYDEGRARLRFEAAAGPE